MVSTISNKKAIKAMCSLARRRVRQILNSNGRRIETNVASFSLSPVQVMSKKPGGRKRNVTLAHMQRSCVDTMRMYIDPSTCFCSMTQSMQVGNEHEEDCTKKRERFGSRCEAPEVAQLLQICFDRTLHQQVQGFEEEAAEDNAEGDDVLPDREEDEEGCRYDG